MQIRHFAKLVKGLVRKAEIVLLIALKAKIIIICWAVKCVETCPDDYYKESTDWKCTICYKMCEACKGAKETECIT